VIKNNNGTQIYYHYDMAGRLIAETDAQGRTTKEYLYANGRLIALVQPAVTGNAMDIILDNSDATYSDNWPTSTSVAGHQGTNYQYHAGDSTGPGTLGNPIDNLQASFTDNWERSTSVKQYHARNYQYHAGTAAGPGTLGNPVDNPQVTFTGSWPLSTSVKQFYSTNFQYHAAGTGANTATWSAGVSAIGGYDIYTNWTAHPNRASNAKYTIHYTGGSDTVIVNQQQNGGQWTLLGTYTLDFNSTISLSDDANGYVIADAISILPAGASPTITPATDETVTWGLKISNPGYYDVYATWTAHPNRASNAKYIIQHSSGSDTVIVNQQQNGGQWNLLGTYTLDQNSQVSLSNAANGYVIADAITVQSAGTSATTLDNSPTAIWTPHQSGEYQIYANWTAHANRASNAKYTIQHTGGSDTLTVNQQQNGGQWQLLGSYQLDSNSQISLSSAANGYVIADGIRLLPTTANTTPGGIFYVHNDHLGTPLAITDENQTVVWQASYDPFGKATITTETITNNTRFPGQYFDKETGLHYNYYRYYDPYSGRYITSDPIGLAGGLNTYSYVGGNPLSYTDPQGLFFWDVLDLGFFAQSLHEYSRCPSNANAINLGLDTIGLLPGIPALGIIRRIDDAFDATKSVSQKPIVVGENMKRVKEHADKIGGHAYRPWTNAPFDFGLGMKRNERWINDQMRNGRKVIDIGPDFQRRAATGRISPFYEMERRNLKGYNNYQKTFERNGNQGGVQDLDF
jgi:RHS repeat-associated protein